MQLTYLFHWVTWNTFLAVIPVAAGYAIHLLAEKPGRSGLKTALMVLFAAVWLAFLPNTCYLLTEWRHFLSRVGYTHLYARWHVDAAAALDLMVYTLFYLCYSGIGALTFALAVRPVARLLKEEGAVLWIWGMPFFLLMSVGVYLGLVLRYNSWDLVSRPAEVWAAFINLGSRPAPSFFIIAFAAFLWVVFLVMDVWVDGLRTRWKAMLE